MKNWLNLIAIVGLMSLFFSCKKNDIGNNNSGAVQKPDFAYGVKASEIIDMVNEVRKAGCNCGATVMPAVDEIVWNDALGKAAYGHSEDMKINNYFDHKGSDNSNAGDRIKATGYTFYTYGENIASGQPTETIVMNSWLKSELHCKNIMNAGFKEMGVGRVDNIWTQVFATKK